MKNKVKQLICLSVLVLALLSFLCVGLYSPAPISHHHTQSSTCTVLHGLFVKEIKGLGNLNVFKLLFSLIVFFGILTFSEISKNKLSLFWNSFLFLKIRHRVRFKFIKWQALLEMRDRWQLAY